MAIKQFDLVVIGTGSGAMAVAFPCGAAGWQVAVIDSRPFGGTCALRGCDPKKVLVGAAELLDWTDRMHGKGVRSKGVEIDWPELMRFKRTFTDPVPRRTEERLAQAGISSFHGRTHFVGPTSLQVGDDVLEGQYVVVASEAQPIPLSIPGAEYLTMSDQFLKLNELPLRLIFVGGGYISFEFMHVATRVGAHVTILHRGSQALERFDPDLVTRLVQRTRDLGVGVRLHTEVTAIERRGDGLTVHASMDGQTEAFKAEMVVHGAGRVLEIADLNLGAAAIIFDKNGVEVNGYLQSVSNASVYAAGDAAAGGPPLTPVAAYEGGIVAANLLHGNHRRTNYVGIPSVVFTVPPQVAVGELEQTAREKGLQFRVHYEHTSDWYSSRRVERGTPHSRS